MSCEANCYALSTTRRWNSMPQQQRNTVAYGRLTGGADGGSARSSLRERADLVLRLACLLHVNGQSTQQTIVAAERLSHQLGLRVTIIPSWEELELRVADETDTFISIEGGSPAAINMDHVVSAMNAVDNIIADRLAMPNVIARIDAIAQAPPAPTWLFTL